MYAGKYRVLLDVSDAVFGAGCTLIHPAKVAAAARSGKLTGKEVAAFGRHWGQELALPRPAKKGSGETSNYWVDWILARINKDGSLAEFTAVEVQTIDTTGSYKVLHGRLNIITNNSSNISKFDIDTV